MRNGWQALALVAGLVFAIGCGGQDKGEEAVPGDVISYPDLGPQKTGSNHPPKLHKVGNKEVQVGQELSVLLAADDEDGDSLTFSMYGDMPPGAKFFKPEGRFTWKPDGVAGPYFLTFVVSDKKDFDSETVELRAVLSSTQHPPRFETVGDQFLKIGELFELRLEASDEDGDSLYFSVQGGMPQAATFDAQNAIFRWTPTAADAGTQVRVTFAVSDGALSATMDVNLTVEGGSGSNHPPEIPPFSPLEAVVGQLLQFDVQASDPDGDALAFGIEGALPAGAQFDTVAHHFSWIPAADMTGKSATVTFTASDGQYTASAEANILVTAQSAGCSDDGYEPNNNASQAKPLAAGTYPGLSICDTALSPIDEDWFQVGMAAGQQIDATISFNHALGDLDLALFNPAVRTGAVFYAPGVGDVEKVTYVAPSAGTYLLVAFGTISQKYAVPYTLTLALQAGGTTCAADAKEPNDTAPAAFYLDDSLTGGQAMGGLTICPGDLDFYRLDVACGETMAAGISFDAAAGDLDLYLLDPTGTQALDQSATEAGSETVAWDATSDLGTAYLMVVGYPKESTANTYTMEVYKEELGSCAADGEEPNNGSFAATPVTASGSLPGLTLCCDQDWFSFPAGPGEVTATVTFPAGSTVKAWFTESGSPGQTWNLACAAGKCSGVRTLPASGTLYVAVEGSYATTYALEAVVEKGSTPSGCAGHCGDKSGDCWCDDACAQYGDCCDDVCTACGYCG